jgi:hypothetical protein
MFQAFHCEYSDLDQLRSQCALRIAAALAKLQDPKSFAVKDLTFDKIMGPPTISYPAELVLIVSKRCLLYTRISRFTYIT